MKRRDFIETAVVVPAAVAVAGCNEPGEEQVPASSSAAPGASAGASSSRELPEYAKHMIHSDMDGA